MDRNVVECVVRVLGGAGLLGGFVGSLGQYQVIFDLHVPLEKCCTSEYPLSSFTHLTDLSAFLFFGLLLGFRIFITQCTFRTFVSYAEIRITTSRVCILYIYVYLYSFTYSINVTGTIVQNSSISQFPITLASFKSGCKCCQTLLIELKNSTH